MIKVEKLFNANLDGVIFMARYINHFRSSDQMPIMRTIRQLVIAITCHYIITVINITNEVIKI